MRCGAHCALSPNFGAPATPVPWQTTQVPSNTFLPSAFAEAFVAFPAGAADGGAEGAP